MGWRINLLMQERVVVKSLGGFQRQVADIFTLAAKPALVLAFAALYSKDMVTEKIQDVRAQVQQKLISMESDLQKIKNQFGGNHDKRQQAA